MRTGMGFQMLYPTETPTPTGIMTSRTHGASGDSELPIPAAGRLLTRFKSPRHVTVQTFFLITRQCSVIIMMTARLAPALDSIATGVR